MSVNWLDMKDANPGTRPDEGETRVYMREGKLRGYGHTGDEFEIVTRFMPGNGIEFVSDSGAVLIRVRLADAGGLAFNEAGDLMVTGGGVTLDMMDNMPAGTIMGNNGAEAARPKALTIYELKQMLDSLE